MSYAARRFSREKRLARRRARGLGFNKGTTPSTGTPSPSNWRGLRIGFGQKLKCQHQQKAQSQAGGGAACDEEGPVGRKGPIRQVGGLDQRQPLGALLGSHP